MPLYEYDAVNPNLFPELRGVRIQPGQLERFVERFAGAARVVSGVLEAPSPEEAVIKLNSQQLVPLRLNMIIRGRDGVQQLMRFHRKRDKMMGISTSPAVAAVVEPPRRIRINYITILGALGAIGLLALALLGIK